MRSTRWISRWIVPLHRLTSLDLSAGKKARRGILVILCLWTTLPAPLMRGRGPRKSNRSPSHHVPSKSQPFRVTESDYNLCPSLVFHRLPSSHLHFRPIKKEEIRNHTKEEGVLSEASNLREKIFFKEHCIIFSKYR